MSTHIYRNTSNQDLNLVGVGIIEAGETVESDQIIQHQAIELTNPIEETEVKPKKTVKKEASDGK